MNKPKIFISYSHEDEDWMNDVKRHLSVANNEKQLDIWHDRYIDIGDYWFEEIKKAIKKANVAIFLVSSHFLTSEFIKRKEIPEFLNLQKSKGLIIIPFLISDCDWKGVDWLEKINIYPKDGNALESFQESDQNSLLAKLPHIIREKFYKSDMIGIRYEDSIKNSPKTFRVKELLKNIDIEYFQKIIYPYLPERFFGTLPDQIDDIIDRLLGIGRIKNDQVPIICVFKELNQKKYHPDIEDYIKYLKNYYHVENEDCQRNKHLAELSLIVNVEIQDGEEKYNITTWKYVNGKIQQQIDLDGSMGIKSFLDKSFAYLKQIKNIHNSADIYFEIVLPNEKIYNGIKDWQDSNGLSLIRKYKYVLRLQSRFSQPDRDWKSNWDKLNTSNTLLLLDETLCKNIKNTKYNDELSNTYCMATLEEKIENYNKFFSDVKEFGIPIVLSSLSNRCKINGFKNIKIKECKENICKSIMANHDNQNSNLLFIYDDPNKIPENFKKPEQNLWGY